MTYFYLSVVLEAFTKQILSYVHGSSIEIDFVKETVEILIRDHGITIGIL